MKPPVERKMTDKTPRRFYPLDHLAPDSGVVSSDIWKRMGFSRAYSEEAKMKLALGLVCSLEALEDRVLAYENVGQAARIGHVAFYRQWNHLFPTEMEDAANGRVTFKRAAGLVLRGCFVDYILVSVGKCCYPGDARSQVLKAVDDYVRGAPSYRLHTVNLPLQEWKRCYALGKKSSADYGIPPDLRTSMDAESAAQCAKALEGVSLSSVTSFSALGEAIKRVCDLLEHIPSIGRGGGSLLVRIIESIASPKDVDEAWTKDREKLLLTSGVDIGELKLEARLFGGGLATKSSPAPRKEPGRQIEPDSSSSRK